MRWIDRDRLSVLTGALLLALALARLLETPIRPIFSTSVLGSPLGLNLSASTVMQLIVLGMTITGMASLVRNHPLAETGQLNQQFMFWIIPGLLGMGLASWLNQLEALGLWTAVFLACIFLIPLMFTVEYSAVDPVNRQTTLMQWAQLALVHLTAVLLFTFFYHTRLRSLLSGTAVLLVSTLLATRLFWGQHSNLTKAAQHGLVIGSCMGQMTWILNYWRLSNLQGGFSLFLLFYILVGVIQQAVTGQLDDGRNGRRILFEYGGVAIIALLLIALVVP